MPPSSPSHDMPICPTCGIIAMPSRFACGRCQSPITLTIAPRRTDGAFFACVECELRCRACGATGPLDHLDVDTPATCALCAEDQPLDPDVVHRVLAFAHGVADLAGPNPEGRDSALNLGNLSIAALNPRAAIGVTESHAIETFDAVTRVTVVASPGHPLCVRCNAPLELTLDRPSHADGPSATSRCGGCNERGIYAVPAATHALSTALQAIVATEHRTDRLPVSFGEGESLLCPDCGGAIAVDGTTKFVTCLACKTSSRLPDRAFFRLRPGARSPEPIWLLFRGPSPTRQELLTRARALRDEERVRAVAAADKGRVRATNVARAKRDMRVGKLRGLIVFASLIALVAALAWGVPQLVPYERAAPPNACMARAWKMCDEQAKAYEDREPGAAHKLYTDACKGGYAPSCTHAGGVEEERGGVGAAAKLYSRGCDGGDMTGCARLGSLYERAPFGVPRDYAKAIDLYKAACNGGGALGCANLAAMNEAGRGVTMNETEAVFLYDKACAARDKDSCFVLATRLKAGRGIRKDDATAARLLKQACELGHAGACEEK